MASLEQIVEGLRDVLKANLPDVFVYDDVPDVAETPAVVIMPSPRDSANFNGAFRRGMDTWSLDVMIMIARSDYTISQAKLRQFVDGGGPLSIRRVIHENPTIGLDDGTIADASGVRLYGGEFQTSDIPHVGAVVRVTVRTSPPT